MATGENAEMLQVREEPCGESPDGQKISQFVLMNRNGVCVKVINWEALSPRSKSSDWLRKKRERDTRIQKPRRLFRQRPVLRRHLRSARESDCRAQKFTLDGQEFALFANIPPNNSAWRQGFIKKVWKSRIVEQPNTMELIYVSPDGEEGYPKALTTTVTYSLNDDNELWHRIRSDDRQADGVESHQSCLLNLIGNASNTILDRELTLASMNTSTSTKRRSPPVNELRWPELRMDLRSRRRSHPASTM
ncbi:MAG: hypothetical protein U0872_13790 [Planctomycetaceae bacterium]